MATWADVRAVLAGLAGTRESEGAWRVAGRVLARPGSGAEVRVLVTEAWEQRAPNRVAREIKGTS